jgi:2'-5' RNA ligase
VRLFTAIELDRTLAEAVICLAGELRARVEATAPLARLTWVTEERLHLTVQFIGNVDEGQAARIRQVLAVPLGTTSFVVSVGGVGAFPARGAPRVLVAGVVHGVESLQTLAAEVRQRLSTIPVEAEDREYHPHLTLARVRDARGLRSRELVRGLNDRDLGPTHVEAITLFESRLSPRGPAYVPLQRTRLR